ncbi:hypothetical protein GCM10009602_11680 [Nocardiopsis tropica]
MEVALAGQFGHRLLELLLDLQEFALPGLCLLTRTDELVTRSGDAPLFLIRRGGIYWISDRLLVLPLTTTGSRIRSAPSW